MSQKWVYLFKEGNANMRNLLGGKGANLAEMTNLGMPIPQDVYKRQALQRAMAGLSEASLAGQYLSGTEYFWFLKEMCIRDSSRI